MGVKGWRNFTQPLYELPKGPEWQFGMQLSLSVTETLSCLIPILWSRALVGTSSIVGIKCAILHVHKSWIHWNLYVSYVAYRINISTIGVPCHVLITCIWADFGPIPIHHLTLPLCFACWHQGVGCPDCLDGGVRWSVRATWPPNGEQFKPRSVRTPLSVCFGPLLYNKHETIATSLLMSW